MSWGESKEWKAGDVHYILPDTIHQHFNAGPQSPACALVIKSKPMYMFMNMLFQKRVLPKPHDPAPGAEDLEPRQRADDCNH